MEIVKKNLISIICGVVALLALVAVFVYPLPGMQEDLQKEVSARQAVASSIASLSSATAQMPRTDKEQEPVTIQRFPTRAVIAAGDEAIKRLQDEAQKIYENAVTMNRKALLWQNFLPQPSTSDLSRARPRYRDLMNLNNRPWSQADGWIGKNAPLARTQDGREINVAGTMIPAEQELATARQRRESEIRASRTQFGPGGQPANAELVNQEVQRALATLTQEVRDQRARQGQVYILPDAFSPVVAVMQPQPVESANWVNAYNAQVNLWVHEEFLLGVVQANNRSTLDPARRANNVLDAPIKRILKLDIPTAIAPVPQGGTPAPGFGGAGAPTVELPVNPTEPITPVNLYASGRASNSMYEVVRFTARLHVDAAHLPQTLIDLQRSRFLNVTNVKSITPVDSLEQLAAGFVYGQAPVVEVLLECEVLFLRQWLVPFMPPPVKAAIAAVGQPVDGGFGN